MKLLSTESLEQVYRTHRQGLFSLALSVVGCEQSAEDAIHEAFTTLYRRSPIECDPVAYVFTAVRNASIDISRKTQRAKRAHETLFNGYVPPKANPTVNGQDKVLDQERDQILRRSIDGLPSHERELIIMKTFAQLTFEQIAEILNEPAKTVASRYRRALRKLESELKGKL